MPRILSKTITWVILLVLSIAMLFPLLWMISTSLKTNAQVMLIPMRWIPDPIQWGNYADLFKDYPIANYTGNSLYVSLMNIIGKLLSCTLVAYGFARFRAPGKSFLFSLLLGTMMIPWAVTMVPLFVIYQEIGWYDTFLPLWVPAFFGDAFSIFLLRQFIQSLPIEMEESAKIDGANLPKIIWKIIVPNIRPVLLVVMIFSFFATWNDFLAPLLFLSSDPAKATLQLAIQSFRSQYTVEWNLMMGMSFISIIPCMIVFFFAQKQIIEGVSLTGIK